MFSQGKVSELPAFAPYIKMPWDSFYNQFSGYRAALLLQAMADFAEAMFHDVNKAVCGGGGCKIQFGRSHHVNHSWHGSDRIAWNDNATMIQRGCCNGCCENGYYHESELSPFTYLSNHPLYPKKKKGVTDFSWKTYKTYLKALHKAYGTPYGFFNPLNMSCNLPRARRSPTCMMFACGEVTKAKGSMRIDAFRKGYSVMHEEYTMLMKNIGKEYLEERYGTK